MQFPVFYFSLLMVAGTYTYTFKEDFTKETIEKMIAVAVVVSIFVILFCLIL